MTAMVGDAWRGRIRSLIKARGISYAEASRRAGRDKSYVSNLLKNEQQPGAETLANLAAGLDTTVTYILYGIEMTPEIAELIQAYSDLDPAGQSLIRETARALRRRKDNEPS